MRPSSPSEIIQLLPLQFPLLTQPLLRCRAKVSFGPLKIF